MKYSFWMLVVAGIWIANNTGWAQQPGVPGSTLTSPFSKKTTDLGPALLQPPTAVQPTAPATTLKLLPGIPPGGNTLPMAPEPSSSLPRSNPSVPAESSLAVPPRVPSEIPAYGRGGAMGAGPGRAPSATAARAPAGTVAYANPFAHAQGSVATMPATIGVGASRASGVLPAKPFASYTPPPVLSPYMNLYRGDNGFGAVNNYYSLVKPELDQRAYNQRMQTQVQSLENTTRLQSQELNRLNPYATPTSGVLPAQFMNLQNYYPAYRSPGR